MDELDAICFQLNVPQKKKKLLEESLEWMGCALLTCNDIFGLELQAQGETDA